MFVQTTKSTRADKTYLTYLVRESFRTAQGPRSRTLCNITALPAPVREIIAASLQTPVGFCCGCDAYLKHAAEWTAGKFVVHVCCESDDEIKQVEAAHEKHHTFL